MEQTNWAPEHSDALREYLGLGMSYAEISRAINAKFNTDYSRNAAIGRARRIGLAGNDRPKNWARLPPKPQQTSLHRLREHYAAASRWFGPVWERVELPKLRCVGLIPRHLSLLEPGDCRYPYGGDEEGEAITFCGHPRREDSSYCTAHFHLTRGPDAAPARAVSTESPEIVEAA